MNGISLHRRGGRDLRPARSERRRQVHPHPDADDAAAADVRDRAASTGSTSSRQPDGVRNVDRRHPAGDDERPRAERGGEPADLREALRRSARATRAADRTNCSRPSSSRSGADQQVKNLSGGHAAPGGNRARAGARAADLLPRRADDRARSGVARRRVGDAAEDQGERDLTILLTTHYMDEADRLCDRDRDRRSRRAEGARLADEAQGVDSRQERHST